MDSFNLTAMQELHMRYILSVHVYCSHALFIAMLQII